MNGFTKDMNLSAMLVKRATLFNSEDLGIISWFHLNALSKHDVIPRINKNVIYTVFSSS